MLETPTIGVTIFSPPKNNLRPSYFLKIDPNAFIVVYLPIIIVKESVKVLTIFVSQLSLI